MIRQGPFVVSRRLEELTANVAPERAALVGGESRQPQGLGAITFDALAFGGELCENALARRVAGLRAAADPLEREFSYAEHGMWDDTATKDDARETAWTRAARPGVEWPHELARGVSHASSGIFEVRAEQLEQLRTMGGDMRSAHWCVTFRLDNTALKEVAVNGQQIKPEGGKAFFILPKTGEFDCMLARSLTGTRTTHSFWPGMATA